MSLTTLFHGVLYVVCSSPWCFYLSCYYKMLISLLVFVIYGWAGWRYSTDNSLTLSILEVVRLLLDRGADINHANNVSHICSGWWLNCLHDWYLPLGRAVISPPPSDPHGGHHQCYINHVDNVNHLYSDWWLILLLFAQQTLCHWNSYTPSHNVCVLQFIMVMVCFVYFLLLSCDIKLNNL